MLLKCSYAVFVSAKVLKQKSSKSPHHLGKQNRKSTIFWSTKWGKKNKKTTTTNLENKITDKELQYLEICNTTGNNSGPIALLAQVPLTRHALNHILTFWVKCTPVLEAEHDCCVTTSKGSGNLWLNCLKTGTTHKAKTGFQLGRV